MTIGIFHLTSLNLISVKEIMNLDFLWSLGVFSNYYSIVIIKIIAVIALFPAMEITDLYCYHNDYAMFENVLAARTRPFILLESTECPVKVSTINYPCMKRKNLLLLAWYILLALTAVQSGCPNGSSTSFDLF